MAVREYVGARYVPKFADPVEWQENTAYEGLTIVTYNNTSYTSKKPVPAAVGTPKNNSEYWAKTGDYNAQVEQYRQDVEKAVEKVEDIEEHVQDTSDKFDARVETALGDIADKQKDAEDAIAEDKQDALDKIAEAIEPITTGLATEKAERVAADKAIEEANGVAIAQEIVDRQNADKKLQETIDNIYVSAMYESVDAMKADDIPVGTIVSCVTGSVNAVFKIAENSDGTIKSVQVKNGWAVLMAPLTKVAPYVEIGNTFNASVRYILDTYSVCNADEDYTATETIIVDNDQIFNFHNIDGAFDGSIIELHRYCHLTGHMITNTVGSGIRIGDTKENNVVLESVVDVNKVTAKTNALIIGGLAGVQEITVNAGVFYAGDHIILFDQENAYVGEIYLNDIGLTHTSDADSSKYAIYVDSNKHSNTGINITGGTCEGANNLLYVTGSREKGVEHLYIDGMRVAEMALSKKGYVLYREGDPIITGHITVDMVNFSNFNFVTGMSQQSIKVTALIGETLQYAVPSKSVAYEMLVAPYTAHITQYSHTFKIGYQSGTIPKSDFTSIKADCSVPFNRNISFKATFFNETSESLTVRFYNEDYTVESRHAIEIVAKTNDTEQVSYLEVTNHTSSGDSYWSNVV